MIVLATSTWGSCCLLLVSVSSQVHFCLCSHLHPLLLDPPVHMCDSYLATWHYPVGNSQERETYGDPQHCPALHPNGLLPQTRQVLIPDSQ